MDFYEHAVQYLDEFQHDMRADFRLIPNAEIAERSFPFYALYQHEDTATLIMKNGKSVLSYEFCYFDTCEQLNEEALQEYFQIIDYMADSYVPWTERSHGFSMLSLVILTEGTPDRTILKQLKRFKCERKPRREEDGFGWCSGRICVVDMSTGKTYVNSHGKNLENRVKLTVKKL